MTSIKTLAGLKRHLKVGTKILLVTENNYQYREVVLIQNNAVAYKVEGEEELKWLHFPKAKEISFHNNYFSFETLFGDTYKYYYQ